MNDQEQAHVELLRARPCCLSDEFVAGYYGLRMQDRLRVQFDRWRATISGGNRCGDRVDRTLLEMFFQQRKMVPHKWMGACLGMTENSVREVLARQEDIVLPTVYQYFDDQVVLEAFKDDLLGAMKTLRFRTFGNHSDFCRRLHAALSKEFGITVEPLMCTTSMEMGEEPALYAHDFDCVTFEPLSVKHSIWLNFGKPISLPPDRCSRLFFVRNREELEFALAGMGSVDGLEIYEQAARRA